MPDADGRPRIGESVQFRTNGLGVYAAIVTKVEDSVAERDVRVDLFVMAPARRHVDGSYVAPHQRNLQGVRKGTSRRSGGTWCFIDEFDESEDNLTEDEGD